MFFFTVKLLLTPLKGKKFMTFRKKKKNGDALSHLVTVPRRKLKTFFLSFSGRCVLMSHLDMGLRRLLLVK